MLSLYHLRHHLSSQILTCIEPFRVLLSFSSLFFTGSNMCLVVGLGFASSIIKSFEIVDLRAQPKVACTFPPSFPIDALRAISLVDPSSRLCICGGRQSTTQYNNQCYCQQNGTWVEGLNMLEKRYFAGVSRITFSNGTQVKTTSVSFYRSGVLARLI